MVNKDVPAKPLIIWLGTNTCAGDMLSLLNAKDPGYQELISSIAELRFDYLLGASEGSDAINVLDDLQKNHKAAYILVVEGSIPTRSNGLYSVIGTARLGRLCRQCGNWVLKPVMWLLPVPVQRSEESMLRLRTLLNAYRYRLFWTEKLSMCLDAQSTPNG